MLVSEHRLLIKGVVREHHRAAAPAYRERVVCFSLVLHEYVERAEQGFQVQGAPTSSVEDYGRRWVEDRTLQERYRRRELLLRRGLVRDKPVDRAAREKPNRRTPRLRRARSPRAGRRARAVQAPSDGRRGR